MAAFDEDDNSLGDRPAQPRRNRGDGRHESWDVDDDGPGDRDLVPDEMTTVRCAHCRKFIFQDAVACPYCGTLQIEPALSRKPLWFIVTVIFCIGSLVGGGLMYLLGLWPWR